MLNTKEFLIICLFLITHVKSQELLCKQKVNIINFQRFKILNNKSF